MEVIESSAIEVQNSGWQGDFPFYLVIEPEERTSAGNIGIDLDEPGWIEHNREAMRAPGAWWLYHKGSGRVIFGLIVEPGDQPYFRRRHIGNLMLGSEITAVGIGKKKADGTTVDLWLLPNGVVCGADDVETIAGRMLGG
jgi:hypothetical protein